VAVAAPRTTAEVLAAIAARHPAIAGPDAPSRDALARSLGDDAPWQLVDPRAPGNIGTCYEEAVARGRIPTRDGSWHDAFNLLAFLAWPRAKTALHARVLQCQRQRRTQGQSQRGREEDALALLDEVALVVSGPTELVHRFDAHRRAGVLPGAVGPQTSDEAIDGMDAAVRSNGGLRVRWFGHALLEHLVLGRPPVTAGVWSIVIDDDRADDAVLAAEIEAGVFTAPCVSPGIPWPDPRVLSWIET
jgi:hypothetical protein